MTSPLRIRYPEELPVSRERERICAAMRTHPVVIVCGDTGSGKTTQLPKMMAEVLGDDPGGKIGVTQPRRLAAIRMAARVAEECGVDSGGEVGVRVRFDDRTSRETRIQFMTDGLLLAQMPRDPDLREYRAIMVDEAHERSLNIDFLLGCLQGLLKRRPDLKVVLSSATLDAKRFSEFFGGAPILEVEGRLFPIRDVYRPEKGGDRPLSDQVLDAVRELDGLHPGLDTLVFLPGEREIRDTARKLEGAWDGDADILPLFARLGGKDQDRAFRIGDRRRVVLATNVAETSVTLPGIRAVIDTGEVRLQRFHPQSGIQRLVTERVSQASAKQRRGRCGRTGPGICVRLYSEEELEASPVYADPEIRRASLAEVILRMAVLGLPPLNDFPLLDPPKGAAINQGVRTLVDIGAMTSGRRLTPRGRLLASFPLDPRLARMLEAGEHERVLPAVLVAVAFLSIQDPRERPADKTAEADSAHAAWRDPGSDFLGILKLWNALAARPSTSKRNRYCRQHFLHPVRVREWVNLVADLRRTCREHKWELPTSIGELELIDTDGFHRALLAGVPRSVGQREDSQSFRAPSGKEFRIFPGSALAKKPPKWVMAFALVETSRLWARECAALRPEWIEQVAPHLCWVRYERPVWNPKRGFVEAEERVQLGPLTLRQGSRVHYGRVDPETARAIFLEDGLLPGQVPDADRILAPYRDFLEGLGVWERKWRQPDALTASPRLLEALRNTVPPEIFTAKAFRRWAKGREWIPSLGDLLPEGFRSPEDTPDRIEVAGIPVEVEYVYAPDRPEVDGATYQVREDDLPDLPKELLEWPVPAWQPEAVEALIRSLDKRIRVQCAPYGETAREALAWMRGQGFAYTHSLYAALAAFLAAKLGCILAAPDLDPSRLPPYCVPRLRVVGADGEVRYEGGSVPKTLSNRAASPGERFPVPPGLEGTFSEWPATPIPEEIRHRERRWFPALVPVGEEVCLRGFRDAAEAERRHRDAAALLFRRRHPETVRHLERNLPLSTRLQLDLSLTPSQGENALEDVLRGILRRALKEGHGFPRCREEFEAACDTTRARLFAVGEGVARRLAEVFAERGECSDLVEKVPEGPTRRDLDLQSHLLWRPGWCEDPEGLERIPVYLRGIRVRVERALRDPVKDVGKLRTLEPALDAFAEAADGLSPARTREAIWNLEEVRLAIFAPELKPRGTTSVKRFREWLGAG